MGVYLKRTRASWLLRSSSLSPKHLKSAVFSLTATETEVRFLMGEPSRMAADGSTSLVPGREERSVEIVKVSELMISDLEEFS